MRAGECACKPSSVPPRGGDGHLSPPFPAGRVLAFAAALDFRSRRATVSTPEGACDRIGDCSGEDCPFHPARSRFVTVALAENDPRARSSGSLLTRSTGLSMPGGTSPAFAGHRALRCSDFPLTLTRQRPSRAFTRIRLSRGRAASRAGGDGRKLKGTVVPKEGLEPSRPCEHYALNVARLPIPPLRHEVEPTIGFEPMTCCLRNSCSATELRRPFAARILPRDPGQCNGSTEY